MTTLFAHFLAQVLGCANLGNVHNRVRNRLLFQPDHGLSAAQVDDFLLNGSTDEQQLAFWAELLSIDLELLRDAAHLAHRSAELQSQRLPRLEVTAVGTPELLAPQRQVRVSIRIEPGELSQPERLARLGERWLQRDTGYTVSDLNQAGAFERILAVANQHWQDVEQLTGAPADAIDIELVPQAG